MFSGGLFCWCGFFPFFNVYLIVVFFCLVWVLSSCVCYGRCVLVLGFSYRTVGRAFFSL